MYTIHEIINPATVGSCKREKCFPNGDNDSNLIQSVGQFEVSNSQVKFSDSICLVKETQMNHFAYLNLSRFFDKIVFVSDV